MNNRTSILLCLLLIGLNGCNHTISKNENPSKPTFVTGVGNTSTRLDPGETRLFGMWAPTKRVVIPEVIKGKKVAEIVNFSNMMSGTVGGKESAEWRLVNATGLFGGDLGRTTWSSRPKNHITEEIVIPGTVRKIRHGAFHGFPKLKKITFSEGLVEIEDYAFASCRQLEAVEFPRSLRKIGKSAFNGCEKLHSIVFKEGVETIGDHAFSRSSPPKVTFPKSLKSLGLVFEDCRRLKTIIFLGDRPVAHSKRKEITKRSAATVYYDPRTKDWGATFAGCRTVAYRGDYDDNKMNGQWTWWHSSRQKKKEGAYKDGQPDGLFVEWHPNGQKRLEYTYKDGLPDGLFVEWYPNGQKRQERTYKDGELMTMVDWKPDGERFSRSMVIVTRTGNVANSGTDDLVIHTHVIFENDEKFAPDRAKVEAVVPKSQDEADKLWNLRLTYGLNETRDNAGFFGNWRAKAFSAVRIDDLAEEGLVFSKSHSLDVDDSEAGSTDFYSLPFDYPVSKIQGVELVVVEGWDAWRAETVSFQFFDDGRKSKPYVFEVNQWFSAQKKDIEKIGAIKSKMFSFRPELE